MVTEKVFETDWKLGIWNSHECMFISELNIRKCVVHAHAQCMRVVWQVNHSSMHDLQVVP